MGVNNALWTGVGGTRDTAESFHLEVTFTVCNMFVLFVICTVTILTVENKHRVSKAATAVATALLARDLKMNKFDIALIQEPYLYGGLIKGLGGAYGYSFS